MAFVKPDGTAVTLGALSDGEQILKTGGGFVGSSPGLVILGSDRSNSTVDLDDCTGLSFTNAPDSDYWFRFVIVYQTAATTTGITLSVNSPSAVLACSAYAKIATGILSGAFIERNIASLDATTAASGSIDLADTNTLAIVEGLIFGSSTGSQVILRFASEVAMSTVTIKAGSVLQYGKLS